MHGNVLLRVPCFLPPVFSYLILLGRKLQSEEIAEEPLRVVFVGISGSGECHIYLILVAETLCKCGLRDVIRVEVRIPQIVLCICLMIPKCQHCGGRNDGLRIQDQVAGTAEVQAVPVRDHHIKEVSAAEYRELGQGVVIRVVAVLLLVGLQAEMYLRIQTPPSPSCSATS